MTRFLDIDYDRIASLKGGNKKIQAARPYSVTVSADQSRCGAHAVRSELRFSDPPVAGGPRAETEISGRDAQIRYRAGSEFYYGFSVLLEAPWVDDGVHEDIIFQWKNSRHGTEDHKDPDVFLAVKRGGFVLRVTSDPAWISSPQSVTKTEDRLFHGVRAGTWYDFIFRMKWSFESRGEIEAWIAAAPGGYRRVLEREGPNMHNDEAPGYLKWGIYKPVWRRHPTAAERRIVFHDEIRVGATWDEVRVAGCRPRL